MLCRRLPVPPCRIRVAHQLPQNWDLRQVSVRSAAAARRTRRSLCASVISPLVIIVLDLRPGEPRRAHVLLLQFALRARRRSARWRGTPGRAGWTCRARRRAGRSGSPSRRAARSPRAVHGAASSAGPRPPGSARCPAGTPSGAAQRVAELLDQVQPVAVERRSPARSPACRPRRRCRREPSGRRTSSSRTAIHGLAYTWRETRRFHVTILPTHRPSPSGDLAVTLVYPCRCVW